MRKLSGLLGTFSLRSVSHRVRLAKEDDYFLVIFDNFWGENNFFEAAGAVSKIGSSLKPNNHNQVKLVQILDTLCSWVWASNLIKNMVSVSSGDDDDFKTLLQRNLDFTEVGLHIRFFALDSWIRQKKILFQEALKKKKKEKGLERRKKVKLILFLFFSFFCLVRTQLWFLYSFLPNKAARSFWPVWSIVSFFAASFFSKRKKDFPEFLAFFC